MVNTNLPLKLAKPAKRALTSAGISKIEQLTDWKEADLKKLHGMGPKAMGQLLAALQEKGLSFKD
ncbi:DNA-directed RNA polymerase subunit alpha C-terminal domain-containing protein [Fictibacillus nanhaiensis]|uniref:DNA-directed RNA polymerase subunit alpha C-terminal domain-containing protein n=1 Tax=Fictibacillus nanhaiensis TaxID=742169 RepID=UPI002E203E90|nr:DNA-directed RNA polymerase subunit alpha C-terminal domain-containing protein [Fictibacillus nanhaiensis]MED1864458.1 DNA-directed RNA polymerase subunit alpha C-terminal domain-containing protein [Fictibacillus nanhaiensis]